MRTHRFNKVCLVAVMAAMVVLPKAHAANLAKASGMLADVAAIVVQAKQNLAIAANSGNVTAIGEAAKRADASDAAMAEAMEAFAALERADAGENDDAADSAFEDIQTALQKATEALSGAIPEETAQSKHKKWKDSQKNTGGGPGRPYDPPNIYDVPWHSQNLRSFYNHLFGGHGSYHFGGGDRRHRDRDATPE